MELEDLVAQDEGLRLLPYKDTLGVLTIGYGRNLEEGISKDEAELMRANDCARARKEASTFYWFGPLDPVRRLVVLSMIFQLGLSRFLDFDRTIVAIRNGDYGTAAVEMRSSLWATQCPKRALKLSKWMETGTTD